MEGRDGWEGCYCCCCHKSGAGLPHYRHTVSPRRDKGVVGGGRGEGEREPGQAGLPVRLVAQFEAT